MSNATTYVFVPFRLAPDQRSLTVDDKPVKLGGRAFDTLLALVERRDRTVSKHELLDVVWPRLVVEENNLQVQIVALRKLLGHQAIATVPGRGYRFTLPVECEVPQSGDRSAPTGSAATAGAPEATARVARELWSTSNLPNSHGALYGRDDDMARVQALLAPHRAVTIAGAGGVGKTRLAQAVAGAARTQFPDGVCWVELAALADDALVPAAVAHALGLQVGDGRDATEAVLSRIFERRLLFVLDNCEQVLRGVSAFVDAAISAASDSRFLVTSQEVLRVTDEHVYRLPPLDVSATADVALVQASGAGALFCARATAAAPRFVLTPENVAAVVEICHQLDGIPLAIELAAARVPLLGVEGIRSRLRERFSVLTAGARIVLRRHQTLRAALEWSHGLLSTEEQTVFRRVGIFVGGFTLESAQLVADDETIDTWDVLEHLGALVDKSLVVAEGEPVPRYRMLETTRLYALERLADAGETARLTERHAHAMLAVLSLYDLPTKRFRSLPSDRAALVAELDNVRAAVDWADRSEIVDEMKLDLVGKSSWCFSFASVGKEWSERVSSFSRRVEPSLPDAVRARFWLGLAAGSVAATRREGFDAAREAADIFARLGDDEMQYWSLAVAIGTGAGLRVVEDVGPLIVRAEQLQRPEWPPRLLSFFEWAGFCWFSRQGDAEQALRCARRQSEFLAASGLGIRARLIAAANIGYCELVLGRAEAAEQGARDALAASGGDAGSGHVLDTLMQALVVQGRYDEAVEVGRRALKDLELSGDEFGLLETLAFVAVERGRLRDAAFVAGHVDAIRARREHVRWPMDARWRQQLDASLDSLPLAELSALKEAGAVATTRTVFAHAFGDVVIS